jgi:hypothetical protein
VREISTTYERALGPTSAVSATLVQRKTTDIIEDRIDPTETFYIIDNVPELSRKYYGVELRYRAQLGKVLLQGNYTWSKSRGNVEYTQSLGTDWDYPIHRVNRWGYLTDDTRHAVKVNGYWAMPLAFQLAWDYTWISGYPFNFVDSTLPYGDEFLEPRGTRRLPGRHNLNLDVRKRFTVGKNEFAAILSVINVFDSETIVQVGTRPDTFGQPFTYATPRRYEIGAKWAF